MGIGSDAPRTRRRHLGHDHQGAPMASGREPGCMYDRVSSFLRVV